MRSFFPIKSEEYKKFGLLCLLATAFVALSIMLRDVKDVFALTHASAQHIVDFKMLESTYDFGFIAYFIIFSFLLKQRLFFNLTNFLFLCVLSVSYLYISDIFYLSAFYIACKLFNFYAMMLLFYTFTNSLLNLEEAKRFYPLILLVSGIPAFGIGFLLPYAQTHFLLIAVPLFCIILFAHHQLHEASGKVFEKLKGADFKKIFTSPVVYLVASIVMFYDISYQFVSFIFKNNLKNYAISDKGFYNSIMGYLSLYTGLLMMVLTVISIPLVVKKSWRFLGMITPVVLLIVGGAFFVLHPLIQHKELLFYGAAASFVIIKACKYFMMLTNQFAYVVRSYVEKSAGRAFFEGWISVVLVKLFGIPLSLALESKTKTINQICTDNAPFYFVFVLLMFICVHLLSKVMKKYE